MGNEEYTRDDLDRDLFLMVKAGLLDISMREDGEWVYRVNPATESMTDEEITRVLESLGSEAEDLGGFYE
jgi:predicted PhzF superfamily epimerase YddE/YHI9